MSDWFGYLLQKIPWFRGMGLVVRIWKLTFPETCIRLATLPDHSVVRTNLHHRYERMIWLQNEEWRELQYLQWKLKTTDTFIDVGANMGIWTLVAASTVGPQGRVFSFEPNPSTYEKLQANVALNEAVNVELFQQAASDTEKTCRLEFNDNQHQLSKIVDDNEEGAIEITAVPLDHALSHHIQNVSISGIKMDTEGHELPALKGLEGILRQHTPWLVIEFNSDFTPTPVLKDWPVYQYLSSLNYTPWIYSGPKCEKRITDKFKVKGYRNILFLYDIEPAN